MIFKDPVNILWIFVFIPVILYIYWKVKPRGHVKFSAIDQLKRLKPSGTLKFRHALIGIRVLAICLLVFAMMRPQKGIEESKIETEGIDVVLAIDVSGSMMAEDFVLNGERKNRLDVVKEVVQEFVKKRTNDRIGLVVFSAKAFMQCPLTLDYGVLLQFLDRAHIGMIEDGTAVGDGIAMALSRLRKIKSKTKIIILLTDGVNNRGKIEPEKAAELAKSLNVKVYTIGAGTKGRVPYPAQDFFGNKVYQWVQIDLDEDSLKKIAATTGAQYFRATDTESLRKIYGEIDRLEKTKIEVESYTEYKEMFPWFALFALLLICAEVALRYTRFRTLP